MYADTRFEPKIEQGADPLSLDSLIAWLEEQPAKWVYDYTVPSEWLVAKWLKSAGVTHFCLMSGEVRALFDGRGDKIVHDHPRTFGAALARAKAARAAS